MNITEQLGQRDDTMANNKKIDELNCAIYVLQKSTTDSVISLLGRCERELKERISENTRILTNK